MRQLQQQQNQASFGQLASASWKQKIGFLEQLSQHMKGQEMAISPQLLENIWLDLVKENNLNVLQKAVLTLKAWVQVNRIKSIRVQRELVRSLMSLSKMGRAEIDSSVVSIVTTLLKHEAQGGPLNQRRPLTLIDPDRFNSSNNPTFLLGSNDSDVMD